MTATPQRAVSLREAGHLIQRFDHQPSFAAIAHTETFVLVLCALFIAFQAGVGFLFGQVFAGHFSVAASLAGCAGLACAVGAVMLAAHPVATVSWVRWAALAALVGVALDIASYYLYLAIPGNYYPWLLVLPYALCIAWVGYTAHRRSATKSGADDDAPRSDGRRPWR